MAATGVSEAPRDETRQFFGHPRGLATLFMTEMWERFSFYGMRALLTLYLVAPPDGVTPPGGGLGFTKGDASAVYGTYIALVYVFPLVGGWIADRMWGSRKAVLVGGIIIASGHYLMATPWQSAFWIGLLLIAMGTGLLKPCISAIVGGLYDAGDDSRRDAGFSIFYMGINLGALFAPLICGTLATQYNWHVGFAAAGVGMTLGLIQYLVGHKHLGHVGVSPVDPAPAHVRHRAYLAAAGFTVALVAVIAAISAIQGGFRITTVVDVLTVIIVILPIVYFWRLFTSPKESEEERRHVKAYLFLFLGSVVFWMIFDQAGSTLNLFAESNTNRSVLGWDMPATFLQSVNPVMIIIFAPVFAAIWTKLGDRAPATPVKFGLALIGVGASFVLMVIPGLIADGGALASVWWLIGVYLIQTWSELLLSPTGLSVTTRLAPAGMESQLLALWFLSIAVGDTIGGQVARALEGVGLGPYFAITGGAAAVFGVILLALTPIVRRLMGSVK